jgi:3-hexulose-6-phosphate synthase
MAKLQVALDLIEMDRAIELIQKISPCIDIIEAGTSFVLRYGMQAVARLRECFPDLQILCDGKIMDAGQDETNMMLDAGAEWVTVMACTDKATIRDCVLAAHSRHARVMADMLCVEDFQAMVEKLEDCDVDCIAVHVGVDQQAMGQTPLNALRELRACEPHCMVAVAGGISPITASDYLTLNPDILIVGAGILNSESPQNAARSIRGQMKLV